MDAKIGGRLATFCDTGCADAFREDRRVRLAHGRRAIDQAVGRVRLSLTREAWSLDTGRCAYCSAVVEVAA